ncbi:GDSL-type esterase/lipase family protein, partial [Candidatus Eisenbacteria bacterium]
VGNWVFQGFELDDGKSLASPPARPPRRIEFYGDSNLAGYSLESEENESGGNLRGSYYGYAGIVSRMFDAEYHNVSRSGAKIADINAVYNRYAYLSPAPAWDFNLFPADVVVVNLGANNVGRPVNRIRSDYHDFLDDLRSVHPGAHIMLYNGWGWDYDEPANYTHEVIAERGDPNMSSAIFPWVFEQWHGCEYDHAGMAQVLADHLTAVMGWAQGPRDVMNGYGMNGDVANGGFEEEAPFGGYGWRYLNDEGVDRIDDPAGAYEGSHYLRLSNGAASHQPNPAEDGDTFTLSVWMRGGQAGDQVDITMDFRDQEMWTSPLQTETETKTLTADWQQYSMTATAPTGAAKPVFHTRVTFASAAGDIVDIDGVVMSSGAGIGDTEFPSGACGLSAYPNPFKPGTKITLRIPEPGHVVLNVYDVSGRRVARLIDGCHPAGEFTSTWDGRDENGRDAGPGIYFAQMITGTLKVSRKMVRLN